MSVWRIKTFNEEFMKKITDITTNTVITFLIAIVMLTFIPDLIYVDADDREMRLNNIPEQTDEYLIGDVNLDGICDVRDLVEIHYTGDASANIRKKLADMNDDGKINNTDIVQLRELLSGKRKHIWIFDFFNYTGDSTDPGAWISQNTEIGKEYTFSFSYCVMGETTGTTVINAAKEWGLGSEVSFNSEPITGKGIYSVTFTADTNNILPVFQTHIPYGRPKLYVWDISMKEKGNETNRISKKKVSEFSGTLKDDNLVSMKVLNPDKINTTGEDYEAEQQPEEKITMWSMNFDEYMGEENDLNAFFTTDVMRGEEYTFSFDYCINGDTKNTSIINAACDWLGASQIKFPNSQLNHEGSYHTTFTADYTQVLPTFQMHAPVGKAKLTIWNLKLIKSGTDENLLNEIKLSDFQGNIASENLITMENKYQSELISSGDGAPTTENTAVLYNAKSSSYDEKAEKKRQSILNTEDTLPGNGTVYYVSWRGDDSNDGKSTLTPWRSASRVSESVAEFGKGDTILFERGGIYRGTINLTSDVSYGAYGTGEKPQIYGSPRNYAARNLWKKAEKKNVWVIDVSGMNDVGNIVFNHGVKCGIKRLTNVLINDFQFYHDIEAGKLYLYYSKGNPAENYADIEICDNRHIMSGAKDTSNVTIENLCLRYTGGHGIMFITGSKNIRIRGCEIGYVGGSLMNYYGTQVRYGNGIEIVDNCNNIIVENNWIYQCYDAGITHQSSNPNGCSQSGVTINDNLVEYCCYNIEYYVDTLNGKMKNICYENNILRFAGYQFERENRIGGTDGMASNICNYCRQMNSSEFYIRNNVLDTSKRYQITIGSPNLSGKGPIVTGNSFIQNGSEVAMILDENEKKILTASSYETLVKCVGQIDVNPENVIYE